MPNGKQEEEHTKPLKPSALSEKQLIHLSYGILQRFATNSEKSSLFEGVFQMIFWGGKGGHKTALATILFLFRSGTVWTNL